MLTAEGEDLGEMGHGMMKNCNGRRALLNKELRKCQTQ